VSRKENVNALMAATGMLRANAWVDIPKAERETLTLETVKLAVELGADLNLANTDGRTALDAAKALRYQSVVDFLTAKGARPGVPGAKPNDSRGRDGGRGRGQPPAADPTK
jgi:hypothetical protein